MDLTRIAVWERKPYWVPELQRTLDCATLKISACRAEIDVEDRLASQFGQLVVVSQPEGVIPWRSMTTWIRRGVRVHLVLDRSRIQLRWCFSELGAASVFDFAQAQLSLAKTCQHCVDLIRPHSEATH